MVTLISDIYAVFWREVKHLLRQKMRILAMIIQPFFWLALIGTMMNGLVSSLGNVAGALGGNALPETAAGNLNYLSFMAPGIMVMTSLFGGLFGGMSVLWDRRLGFLNKMLSSPIARTAVPLGKICAVVFQSLIQVTVIAAIAILMGVRFASGVPGFLLMLFYAALFSGIMASISIALSSAIKSHETFIAIINFITMPLMFTSNAMFPTAIMPGWLKLIAEVNPISFAVGPIRSLVMEGFIWDKLLVSALVLILFFAVLSGFSILRFRRTSA